MDAFLINVIKSLQSSFEFWGLSFVMFVVTFVGALITRRFFGYAGLVGFNSVALVAANILALKLTDMTFVNELIALGTVVFSSTLLVSDLIVEDYGLAHAKKSVWATFFLQFVFMLFMIVGLAFPVLTGSDELAAYSNGNHNAMMLLFVPSLRIFIAAMAAFLAGQFVNVYVFDYIANKGGQLFKSLRYYIAMFVSEITDIIIFSSIAWKLLNPIDLTWSTVFWTYMFTTFILRTIIIFLNASAIRIFGSYSIPPKN